MDKNNNSSTAQPLAEKSEQVERALRIDPSDIQRIAGQNGSLYQLDLSEEQLDNIVLYQQGDTLALAYDGEFVLAIDDFFNPQNNLALSLGGTLVFNAESPVIDDGGVIWRREDEDGGVLFWLGTGAGAAALGAAAGGGGGGGGGTVDVDTTAPLFTSADIADPLPEHSGEGISVYQAQATDLNPIQYSLGVNGDSALFTIDPDTGVVTFNIDAEFDDQQSYQFTVIATDSFGNSSQLVVTLPITEVIVNLAPEITSGDSATVAENVDSGTQIYLAEATDPNLGDTISYSLAPGSSDRFAIDATTGVVTVVGAIDFESTPSLTFTVIATDSGGLTDSQTVTVTVTDVDEAPEITSGNTATIAENSDPSAVIYVAAASDPDGDDVTYSLSGDDADKFTLDAISGELRLIDTADTESQASYSVVITASSTGSSGSALSSSQPLTIAVTNVDEGPAITSGSTATIAENSASSTLVYQAVAEDPEDDDIVYSLAEGGDNALFEIDADSGAVTLLASADFESDNSYTITVIATANGKSDSQTVTVTVTDVDEGPAITSGSTATIAENSPSSTLVYQAVAEDPEDDTIVYSLAEGGDNALFEIDADSGAVTLLASADFESDNSYTITVFATANGKSDSQTVTVTVTDVDEAPAITSGNTATVAENSDTSAVIYVAAASDPDGDDVTYSLSGDDADKFTLDAISGELRLIDTADAESQASYSVVITASSTGSSGSALSSSQPVTVAVTDVDEGPAITSGNTATVAENSDTSAVIYVAAASDPDGDDVTYSLSGDDADKFTLDAISGELRLIDTADAESQASYSVVITASSTGSSGSALSSSQPVTVAVTNVDEGPAITSGSTATIAENSASSTLVYQAVAEDPEDDDIVYSLAEGGDNALFEIDADSGAVTLLASADFESDNSYSITVIATANGKSDSQTVTVTVTDVDEAPAITSGSTAIIAENSASSTLVYQAVAEDPEDDTIVYSLAEGGDNALFEIDADSGAVTLLASADFESDNSYSITVIATANGKSDSQTVTMTVTDVDEGPAITSGSTATIAENSASSTLVYQAVAEDPEDDDIVYSLAEGGDNALFEIDADSGAVTLLASADFESDNSYTITVIATANGKSDSQAVTVTVTDVDEAPAITSGNTATIAENSDPSAVIYVAAASDPDGDDVTYSLSGDDADKFTLDAISGELRLIDAADSESQATYSVVITASSTGSSGSALSSSQPLTIAVTNVDEGPAITSGSTATIAENSASSTLVYQAVAEDPEDDAIVYSLAEGGDNALFEIDADSGAVTLLASADFESDNSYTITVIATANGKSDSQTVTVTVTDVNEAPTAVALESAVTTLAENSDTTARIKIADIAITDDALGTNVISLTGDDAALFEVVGNELFLKAGTALDYETASSLAVTVSVLDSSVTGSSAVTVDHTVAVTDVNEAPTAVALESAVTTLAENSDTTTRVKIADIAITDDALGTNVISLTGDDAALFEVVGNELFLKAGTALDYETASSLAVTVSVLDSSVTGSSAVTVDHTVAVTDVNEAPTAVALESAVTTLAENSDTTARIKIADIAITDDALGSNVISLTGDDADLFEVVGNELFLKAGTALDYETASSLAVTVSVLDSSVTGSSAVTVDHTVAITDVNEAPSITSGAIATIAENSASSAVVYSTLVSDPDTGSSFTYSLTGTDASSLSIDSNGQVRLNASANFEAKNSYSFNVVVSDGALTASKAVTLTITDINEAPRITIGAASSFVFENDSLGAFIWSPGEVVDPEGDTVQYRLGGTDAGLFLIDSNTGEITLNSALDYEANTTHSLVIYANDGELDSVPWTLTVNVFDVNEAPIFSSAATAAVNENVSQLYQAAATDPEGSAITYSLAAVGDHTLLNINSSGIVSLKTGLTDYETKTSYTFTVRASDGSNTTTKAVTVSVTDLVDETPPEALIMGLQYEQIKLEAAGVTTLDDIRPDILEINDRGDYVVGWVGYKTSDQMAPWQQRFNSDGTMVSGGVLELVAPATSSNQPVDLSDTNVRMTRVSSSGHYVLTWIDREVNSGLDGNWGDPSPYMQLFNPDGTAVIDPFKLERSNNSLGESHQQVAAVGAEGEFAVVWSSEFQSGNTSTTGGGSDIYLQHFNSDGSAKTSVLIIEEGTTGDSYRPEVAAINDAGDYVVIFTSREAGSSEDRFSIRYQKFNANGIAEGLLQEIDGDNDSGDFDGRPEVTGLGNNGAFAFVWHGQDGGGDWSIFVRKVASDGTLQSQTKLEAIGNTSGKDQLPKILNLGDGEDFVVVWHGVDSDGDESAYVQRFDAAGQLAGVTTKLEGSRSDGNDEYIQVAQIGRDGAYVVVWQGQDSAAEGGDTSIYVQRFNPDGTVNGDKVKLEGDGLTSGNDELPKVTATGDRGAFVVSWHGTDSNGDSSIFVQQFHIDGSLDKPVVLLPGTTFEAQSNEAGMLYLVHESRTVTDVESITSIPFDYLWNAQEVTTPGATVNFSTAGLGAGRYNLYAADETGNLSAIADGRVNLTNIQTVVFDLVEGVSSDHSSRTFNASRTYTIYIRVDSESAQAPNIASADWGVWSGANNLGADDKIILIGTDGTAILGDAGKLITQKSSAGNDTRWRTSGGSRAAKLTSAGKFSRSVSGANFTVDLWDNQWVNNPNANDTINVLFAYSMPAGVLTTQGLT